MKAESIIPLLVVTVVATTAMPSNLKCQDAAWHLGTAKKLADEGEWAKALDECTAALKLDQDLAPAHELQGQVFETLGIRGDAVAEYRDAIRLAPNEGDSHFQLG